MAKKNDIEKLIDTNLADKSNIKPNRHREVHKAVLDYANDETASLQTEFNKENTKLRDELTTKINTMAVGIQGEAFPNSIGPKNNGMYTAQEPGIYLHFLDEKGEPIIVTQEDYDTGLVYVVYNGIYCFKSVTPITNNGEVREGDMRGVNGNEVYFSLKSKTKYYNDILTFDIIKDVRISAEGFFPQKNNILFKLSFENILKTSDRVFISNHLPSTYRYLRETYDGQIEIFTTSTTGGFNALLIDENTRYLYAWVCRSENFPNGVKLEDYRDIRISWTKDEPSMESELVEFKNGKINFIDPVFHQKANFLKTWQTDYQYNYYIKKAIKKIIIEGLDYNSKVSLYVIEITTNKQRLVFYLDTGDGSGRDKVELLSISTTYSDLNKIYKVEGEKNGVRIEAFIDYSFLKSSASNNYNSCGFSENIFLNFKMRNNVLPPIEKRGVIDITLVNNNSNSPVLDENRLTDIYTVIPDLIEGKTAGCTGLGFDSKRRLFVVCQYSYANQWYLNLYRKEDLLPYNSTSELMPLPYHKIDLRKYLNSIQGNCYDQLTDSYFVLGNGQGTGGKRCIIRVNYEGDLLEFTEIKGIPEEAQNGMLAIDPITNNIYLSINNGYELFLIDRDTKNVIKTVQTNQMFEGMGVNQKNGNIILAGDLGDVRMFDKDFNVLDNYSFKTFPNENNTQNIEGVIFLDDDTVVFSADCFLHGGTKNGNALFFYDFAKTKGINIKYPLLISNSTMNSRLVDNTLMIDDEYYGVIIDCEYPVIDNIINQFGDYILQFESSNDKPEVEEKHYNGIKYYENWGNILPEKNYNNRYVRVIIKKNHDRV
ncbi:hypothetical protein HX049_02535 [Myroides odoratimimus]|uniref:YncE family protein n=1 Tax=Myroides odoratimimus TaxID=76832 RepID=UPI002575515E|nr:hypothetical protein [Myroides odoratimimus]MDM1396057.1 hypothetical protein [Myroides odoratimimus]